jgi:flagellar biosynthetic protein FliO
MIAAIRKWIENSTAKQKLIASLATFSLLATAALMSMDSASSVSKDPLGSTPFYFISAIVKLIAVLLLIVGSSVIFRRWLQGGPNGNAERQMRLVETIRLSPKQAVHLVMIGDQKLLIGATDYNVSLISSIEERFPFASVAESQPQPGLDFGSMIQTFNIPSGNAETKE